MGRCNAQFESLPDLFDGFISHEQCLAIGGNIKKDMTTDLAFERILVELITAAKTVVERELREHYKWNGSGIYIL